MNIHKSNIFLILVFLAIASQILVMSYMYPKGGLTSDSKAYLLLSQSILDGNGFSVPDLYSQSGKSYFAVWPVGYSVMIAGVVAILPVDLVLASKLVNILLIGFTLWVFSRIFGKEAYVFGSLFFLDSIVRLTYRTWVQTPFICGLILLAIALYQFYNNREQLRWLAAITAIGIFLFLVRYVSLTSLIAVALLGCFLFYRKDYKSFFKLALSGFAILGFAGFYFYINYQNTGHMTGMERIANPDDMLFMIKRFFARQLEEWKMPAIALLLAFFIKRLSSSGGVFSSLAKTANLLSRSPLKDFVTPVSERGSKSAGMASDGGRGRTWPFFLLVGLTYWLFVIILRFNMQFDDFGGRMLGPATILFVIALIDYLRANHKHYQLYRNCLLGVLFGSFLYHSPIRAAQAIFDDKPGYLGHRKQIEQKYANLESRSIVLFGHSDLIYIKDNVQPASAFPFIGDRIYNKPYDGDFKEDIGKDESLQEYIKRRCRLGVNAIYMDVSRWQPKSQGGYTAIQQFIGANKGKTLVKLANCH